MLGDLPQLRFQLVDAPLDAAAIDLELGLARTARADAGSASRLTAALLRQCHAPAPDAGEPVPEQGQLHLRLALLAVSVLGEDVEDHRRTVDGRPAQQLLQVALLGGGELVVEDDRVTVRLEGDLQQLLGLALADVGGRIRCGPLLHQARHLVGPRGVDQLRELVEAGLGVLRAPRRQGDAHQDDLLPKGAFDQGQAGTAPITAKGHR